MENNFIKLLIGDDSADYGVSLSSQLREMGFYTFVRRNTSAAIFDAIIKHQPDVVVVDLTLSDSDALQLIRNVSRTTDSLPVFIVITDSYNSFIERQLTEGGADHVMVKPVQGSELCHVIKSIVRKKLPEACFDKEIITTGFIQKLGIPAHIKGYYFLRTAILSALEDNSLLDSVTKKLYPKVAEEHDSTSSRVERAIRHAISIAWDRGNFEEADNIFGFSVANSKTQPTNYELISLMTDIIRLRMKNPKKYFSDAEMR